MGKPKKVEPEPDKIIRIVGENLLISVTEAEKKYRNRQGPDDVTEISKEKLKCTVCSKSVQDIVKKAAYPFIHTVLGVLMCKECASFYGDGYFSNDEDGDDKYCRWCGQGGTLYLCSACTCAFCKKCLKQNLDKKDIKDIESDDWKCLICNPKPLFECRTVCWTLQEHAKNKAKKEDEEEETEKKSSRSSRSAISEVQSKKRKASEIDDTEAENNTRNIKRKKSEESTKKKTTKNNDDKNGKNNETKSKRHRSLSPKTVSTKTKKSSRLSLIDTKRKQITEVVTLSDSEDEDHSPKKNAKQKKKENATSKLKETPKLVADKNRPKRVASLKREEYSPVVKPIKSQKKPSIPKSSLKKKASPSKKASKKKSSRTTTKKEESEEEEEEEEEEGERLKLISLNDEDSMSESEILKPTPTSEAKKCKTKLTISKSANSHVRQAVKYLDSAINDVSELSVLISNRCEKLCTKSVKINEDVMIVFSKLQQLMSAVHTNLELIEKGVTSKITEWNNEKVVEKSTEEKESKEQPSENDLDAGKVTSSTNDVDQKKDEDTSEQIKDDVMEVDEPTPKEETKDMDVDSKSELVSTQDNITQQNETSSIETSDHIDHPPKNSLDEQEEQSEKQNKVEPEEDDTSDGSNAIEITNLNDSVSQHNELPKEGNDHESQLQDVCVIEKNEEVKEDSIENVEDLVESKIKDDVEGSESDDVQGNKSDEEQGNIADEEQVKKSDDEDKNEVVADTENNEDCLNGSSDVPDVACDNDEEKKDEESKTEDTKGSDNEQDLGEVGEEGMAKNLESNINIEEIQEKPPTEEANGRVGSNEDTLEPLSSSGKVEEGMEKTLNDEESSNTDKPEERETNGTDDLEQVMIGETFEKLDEPNSDCTDGEKDSSTTTRTESQENTNVRTPERPLKDVDDFKNGTANENNSLDSTKEERKPEETESKPSEPLKPKEDTPRPTLNEERRPYQGFGSHSSGTPHHHLSDRDDKGRYSQERHRDDRNRDNPNRNYWNRGYHQGGYQQRGSYNRHNDRYRGGGGSDWRGYR